MLVSGGADRNVRVWDAPSGTSLLQIEMDDRMFSVRLLEDRHIVVGTKRGLAVLQVAGWVLNG